jgi:type VI secretion system protein VasL
MEKNNIHIIKMGGDPSHFDEFETIKSEINKLNHPKQPTVDWVLIENNALILFEKNGIDLLSISYYTLARYHRYGLSGFVEGCELLASLICHQWDELWPTNPVFRVDTLNWFNSRLGSLIRQQDFTIKDMTLLQRACDALKGIVDKLDQVPLEKSSLIDNLFFYIENKIKTLEKKQATFSKKDPKQSAKTILLYLPETSNEQNSLNKKVKQDQYQTDEIAEIDPNISTKVSLEYHDKKRFSWWSFALGVTLTSVCSFGVMEFFARQHAQMLDLMGPNLSWFDRDSFKQPNISLIDNEKTRSFILTHYEKQLRDISSLSPISSYYYTNNLLENVQRLWPEEKKYEQLANYWQNQLQANTAYKINTSNYHNAKMQLQALINKVDNAISEDRYITISHLRTMLDNIQKELDSESPIEEVLRQIEERLKNRKEVTAELKQKFNQQLKAIMTRYYQTDKGY